MTSRHPVARCPRCGAQAAPGARFCAACGAALGELPREERRVVTVLFGDLSGFTELAEHRDAEEVKSLIDHAFADLARIVTGYGGHIDKIIGDEIMAVFGAPVAHEDDAERAVRAALEIDRHLDALSAELEARRGVRLRMHIGINTGEVVAGYVGGSDSYTVVGDPVNTARRIAEAAEAGQILVGDATADAAKAAIVFEAVGAVSAKGKRVPVRVWRALRERGLPGGRARGGAPLVGRDEELSVLDGFTRIVRRDGRPFLVTICGEAGMGKSRVASELAARVVAAGGRVLAGRSLPYGTASPAFALEEMLRTALLPEGQGDGAAEALVRERLAGYGLADEADEICAFLGVSARDEVTATAGQTAPSAGGLLAPGPQAAQPGSSSLLQAAAALLERIAEREGCLVLEFHEAHWAEDAVLDAIERLARESRAPLLVLCLARPELLSRRPAWGTGARSALLLLEPLPRDRAAQLLDRLAPALPAGVRDGVLERAGGNPLYLEELARLIVERDLDPADPSALPVSVHALVTARLDALDAQTKRLVQDAAVIGDRFWPEALRALRPDDDERLEVALGSLVAREFVEPALDAAIVPGGRAYRFRQTLLREVAESSVPKHVRAEQHATIGRWLEETACACGRELEFYDLIAHHYERAASLARDVGMHVEGAAAKAREYLGRAGDHALRLDAASSASEFFQRALEFAAGDEDALALRVHLADALVGSWQLAEAEEHLDRALADARRLSDRAVEGKALRLLGDLMRMRGDGQAARQPIERALEIAKEIGDEREEAEGLRALGLLDIFLGRWSASILWFRQALARYRALEDVRGEAWTLSNLGWASLYLRRFDEAVACFDDALALFDELGDAEGMGWSLSLRAWAQMYLGHLHEADETARQIEERLSSLTSRRARAMGFALDLQRMLRAHVALLLGRLGEAEALASEAVANAERRHQAWGRALGRYPLFMAAMLRRRIGVARAVLEEGLRAAETTRDPAYLGQFVYARAWLAFEEGDLAAAERHLEEQSPGSRDIVQTSSGRRWLLAMIRRAQGRPLDAIAVLRENLGRQNLTLISPAVARALLAELLAETGSLDEAQTEAATALEEAGEDAYAAAQARLAIVRAHLAAGDGAAAEAEARALLAALDGTELHVERLKALDLLARALDAQHRFDESAEAIDRARELLGGLPDDAASGPLETLLQN